MTVSAGFPHREWGERGRDTDRQTETQADRQTDRDRDRDTETETERKTRRNVPVQNKTKKSQADTE